MRQVDIGCEKSGFVLKKAIMILLKNSGHRYQDFGCYNTDSVDYPDIAQKVGEAVSSGNFDQGILICSTGIGMSISANKVRNIKAALCCNAFAAKRARQHNDANILCLRGEDIETDLALEIVRTFLTTEFEGGRHIQRVNKIRTMEGDSR